MSSPTPRRDAIGERANASATTNRLSSATKRTAAAYEPTARPVQAPERHFGRASNDLSTASPHNWGMSGTAPAELQGERALETPRGMIGEPSMLDSPAPGEDAAEAWDVLDARNGGDRPYDEGLLAGPHATEADRRLRRALDRLDLRELCERVAGEAGRRGVCFGTADGVQDFRIDPIPRLIEAAEWRELSAGVAQRVRALECF